MGYSMAQGQGLKPRLELIPNNLKDRNCTIYYFLDLFNDRLQLVKSKASATEFSKEIRRFLSQEQIDKFPLLKWYFDIFRQQLNIGGSKLLVIGYSFLDIHINKIIFDVVNVGNLKLYIWNLASFREISENLKEQINKDEYIDCLENGMIWLSSNKLQDFTSDDLAWLEKRFYA